MYILMQTHTVTQTQTHKYIVRRMTEGANPQISVLRYQSLKFVNMVCDIIMSYHQFLA